MNYTLAIELGGVNTSIYRKNQGLVLKEPSLVCAVSAGNSYILKAIGLEAEKLQGKTNEQTYIFSPIVCGEVKSIEYAAEMLRYFLNKIEVKRFLKEKAVLCVPAGISEQAKKDLKKVCALSGLGKVSFIPSIVCSAHASGVPINSPKTIFCVNVGGTLTDIATINMNSILKGATLEMGGRYLDLEITDLVANKYQTTISVAAAKRIKEEISSLVDNDRREIEIIGVDEINGKPKKIIVFSEDIKPLLVSFMQNIITAIETSINLCAPEISADIAKNGIFVSGGLSSICGLEKYLTKHLNIKVNIIKENENATILSAGRLLSDRKTLNDIIVNF
jgi:rod shape-determining protein MreB